MFPFNRIAQAGAALSRSAGYVVVELTPWVIRALIGWLGDRFGRTPGGDFSLCKTCPFQPPGAAVSAAAPSSPDDDGSSTSRPDPASPIPSQFPPRPAVHNTFATEPALVVLAFLLAVLAIAFGSGCTPVGSYVSADRSTFEAITPEYARYVEADPDLNQQHKDRRLRTVAAWRLRLESAESAAR
ncbi:hypothetical protein [Humisphaera borealis]|uniref:Uncharacterized protein n=1 Tax=Humisphaera borealis TaxID=2807512 RepID=A0A7M2X1L2_9BACT|nr:hypothetical protein [Humisphaera borealis]QOV91638.1 hypothetical protein IPV69_09850 [Humisphaera borealis]